MLKNIDRYLKNFKKDLEKLQKYQYNITYGLDYLFNELNESKGDKDNKLATYKYFDIIRPYLRDMTDDHKAKDEWKIQLTM